MSDIWPGSLSNVQAELEARSLRLTKKLGQNFMIDANIANKIAKAALKNHTSNSKPLVVEVGPGVGHLTRELLNEGAQIIAVELDKGFYSLLQDKFADEPNIEIIHADALSSGDTLGAELKNALEDKEEFYFASNLPYNIATTLMIALSGEGQKCRGGAVTMQLEAAERLVASEGSKIYGAASVLFQLLAKASIVRSLPRSVFWPRPGVTSALVEFEMHTDNDRKQYGKDFASFVKKLFSQRRKKLAGTLRKLSGLSADAVTEILTTLQIDKDARAEVVSPKELLEIYKQIC